MPSSSNSNTNSHLGGPESLLNAAVISQAIEGPLRDTLEQFPDLVLDPDALADRLAKALGGRLAWAAFAGAIEAATPRPGAIPIVPDRTEAGIQAFTRAVTQDPPNPYRDAGTLEDRVLLIVKQHPDGAGAGLSPDMLAALTGLPPSLLGRAVSTLVQAGALIRDAWLVRLPSENDLMPQARQAAREHASGMVERQAVNRNEDRRGNDRRETGERRLYDRRNLEP